jgi:hypothetical protein
VASNATALELYGETLDGFSEYEPDGVPDVGKAIH